MRVNRSSYAEASADSVSGKDKMSEYESETERRGIGESEKNLTARINKEREI